MKRLLLTALASLTLAAPALAGPPTKFLETQVQQVREIIKTEVAKDQQAALDAKLLSVVDPLMEFDGLSERALQKHWPTLSPEQQKRFSSLFRELVFRSYLKKVRGANDEYTLVYEDEEAQGRKAAAVTVIAKTKKADVELVFQLVATEGRKFVAEDVVIDEVSLVANYREQFNKIIAKDGFDALIDKMDKKVADFGGDPLPAVGAAAPPAAPASAGAPAAAPESAAAPTP
jgi:phospholipid transport system substrate-binding protein